LLATAGKQAGQRKGKASRGTTNNKPQGAGGHSAPSKKTAGKSSGAAKRKGSAVNERKKNTNKTGKAPKAAGKRRR